MVLLVEKRRWQLLRTVWMLAASRAAAPIFLNSVVIMCIKFKDTLVGENHSKRCEIACFTKIRKRADTDQTISVCADLYMCDWARQLIKLNDDNQSL